VTGIVLEANFPIKYRDLEVVWLFRKAGEDTNCLICGQPASFTIIDEEGVEFNRCLDCFNQLLEFRRILLVEEDYWIHILSKEFNGLRRNPTPPKAKPAKKPQMANSIFEMCEVCGCRFATQSDLKRHVEAWHKPGGAYYGEKW